MDTSPTGTAAPISQPTIDTTPAPDPTEIPTNIGILVTLGVLVVLGFILCIQDHRKRARAVAAGKLGYSNLA
ncbi:hypothetical protein FRC02_005277 [Tulasnella sp. 418]|nr:hypothetical protein FRC02_005277 [Tulasnella sp. 418]